MPDLAPPPKYADSPVRHVLPAGTELFRVHLTKFDATSFRPDPSDEHFGGGRFDGTERDPYPTYYAAPHSSTALMEYLGRDLRVLSNGLRTAGYAKVKGRQLSAVRTTRELTLVSLLSGPDLAAVAQDEWLIQSEDYGKTRRWSNWIRQQAEWAHGLVWPSKRDVGKPALVLFGDRCGPEVLEVSRQIDLSTPVGTRHVNVLLSAYRVQVTTGKGRKSRPVTG
ncbi:RES family NAD+ phosphorylase [Saccharopolyspora taberi]|uniref:RES domain-containing protein n=1 Tax=Saccharopolyspora taberi TaxID=60895 RepID=A0ABN3VHT8_9PSEU